MRCALLDFVAFFVFCLWTFWVAVCKLQKLLLCICFFVKFETDEFKIVYNLK